MYVGIKQVEPKDNYELLLVFDNNRRGIFDLKPYLNIGRFAELKDESMFNKVAVSFDTIEWANGIDIDPEFVYQNSRMI